MASVSELDIGRTVAVSAQAIRTQSGLRPSGHASWVWTVVLTILGVTIGLVVARSGWLGAAWLAVVAAALVAPGLALVLLSALAGHAQRTAYALDRVTFRDWARRSLRTGRLRFAGLGICCVSLVLLAAGALAWAIPASGLAAATTALLTGLALWPVTTPMSLRRPTDAFLALVVPPTTQRPGAAASEVEAELRTVWHLDPRLSQLRMCTHLPLVRQSLAALDTTQAERPALPPFALHLGPEVGARLWSLIRLSPRFVPAALFAWLLFLALPQAWVPGLPTFGTLALHAGLVSGVASTAQSDGQEGSAEDGGDTGAESGSGEGGQDGGGDGSGGGGAASGTDSQAGDAGAGGASGQTEGTSGDTGAEAGSGEGGQDGGGDGSGGGGAASGTDSQAGDAGAGGASGQTDGTSGDTGAESGSGEGGQDGGGDGSGGGGAASGTDSQAGDAGAGGASGQTEGTSGDTGAEAGSGEGGLSEARGSDLVTADPADVAASGSGVARPGRDAGGLSERGETMASPGGTDPGTGPDGATVATEPGVGAGAEIAVATPMSAGEGAPDPDARKVQGVGQFFAEPGSASDVPDLIILPPEAPVDPGPAARRPPFQPLPAWMRALSAP
jgi:hypothetical protein